MSVERITSLSCWNSKVSVEPLEGGITNRNYLVRHGPGCHVARLCEELPHLGICRRNEWVCQRAAHTIGVAPAVTHRENGVLVSEYLEARTLSDEDLQNAALLERLVRTLKQLHGSWRRLEGEMLYFCPFQTVRTYTATARGLDVDLPDDIDALVGDANELSERMSPFQPTLCHNDLLAANILDDGDRLWLVDWEYAGIGNPLFDLAGVSGNCSLDGRLELVLLSAYRDGKPSDQDVAELRILKTISLLRESLWAFIQTRASDLDFDYHAYAEKNLDAYRHARQAL